MKRWNLIYIFLLLFLIIFFIKNASAYCGDTRCDDPFETPENCPEDCAGDIGDPCTCIYLHLAYSIWHLGILKP